MADQEPLSDAFRAMRGEEVPEFPDNPVSHQAIVNLCHLARHILALEPALLMGRDLQRSVSGLRQQEVVLAAQIEDLTKVRDDLAETVEAAQVYRSELRDTATASALVAADAEFNERLESHRAEYQGKINELDAALGERKAQLEALTAQCQATKEESDRLSELIDELRDTRDRHADELKEIPGHG